MSRNVYSAQIHIAIVVRHLVTRIMHSCYQYQVREYYSSSYSDVLVCLEGAYCSSMVVGGWLGQDRLLLHLYILAV